MSGAGPILDFANDLADYAGITLDYLEAGFTLDYLEDCPRPRSIQECAQGKRRQASNHGGEGKRGCLRCSVFYSSRRRDCHFADTISPSLLKRILKREGIRSRMTVWPAAIVHRDPPVRLR